jgi:serine/threonine-protein kinase
MVPARVAKPTQSIPGLSGKSDCDPDGDTVSRSTDRRAERDLANRVMGGKYRLISEIGRGGMGSVWRAEHLAWEAPVAIKIMSREVTDRPEALARFEREVRLAAGLRSPHVVQVLDHGIDEATRTPFIAMELLEGENLARRLKRARRLSPAETFQIVSHLVRALSRAHAAGIVHRDLKPDNVFLVRNEEESVAKVLDFGVAKWTTPSIPEGGLTRPGSVLGTPFYMSPEQIQGSRNIDHRADLWSLGAITCECLTGRRPFEAKDFAQLAVILLGHGARPLPSSLGPVPPGFDAWFLRATAQDIAQRFQTAREMAQALAPICGVAPTHLVPDFPATEELATPGEVPSMAAVSRTASRVFLPGRLWRLPLARLIASTALTLAVVGSGIALWYKNVLWRSDTPPEPPATQLQSSLMAAAPPTPVSEPTGAAVTGSTSNTEPSLNASAAASNEPDLKPSAWTLANHDGPGLRAKLQTGSNSGVPELKAPVPLKPESAARARPTPVAKAPKKGRAETATDPAPASVDVNGRRIRTSLTASP